MDFFTLVTGWFWQVDVRRRGLGIGRRFWRFIFRTLIWSTIIAGLAKVLGIPPMAVLFIILGIIAAIWVGVYLMRHKRTPSME